MDTVVLVIPYLMAILLAITNFPSRLLWSITKLPMDCGSRCAAVRWSTTVDVLSLPLLTSSYAAMRVLSFCRQRQIFDATATWLFIALAAFYAIAVVWALKALTKTDWQSVQNTQQQKIPANWDLFFPKFVGIVAPGVLDVWVSLSS